MTSFAMPFRETMEEATRLENAEADPKKPYESYYKARDVMKMLKDSLNPDTDSTHKMLEAVVNFRIGRNYLDTEESGDGEKHLEMALKVLLPPRWIEQLEQAKKLLSDEATKNTKEATAILLPLDIDITHSPTYQYIPETIDCLNQSGILWTRRGEIKRALLLLEMAHRLFLMVKQQLEKNETNEDNAPDVHKILDDLNMHTLFFLAQVHGALGNQVESAACCHQTLYMQYASNSYDPVEWAKNAQSLSQHYMLSGEVEKAERCLKAAQQVASEAELPPKDATADDLFGHPTLKVQADIHRAWGKLLSATLEGAAEDYVEQKEKADGKEAIVAEASKKESETKKTSSIETDPMGGLIVLKDKFAWKGRVCPEIEDVNTFEKARNLFRRSRAEYTKALEFYVLDGYVTDHITIQQEISKLYHSLACFETSMKRIAAMEKRRIQLLQPIVEDINNEHYVLKTKELWYECAQAAQEMHETYYNSIEASFQVGGNPSPKDMKKSDEAIFKSTHFYERFLKTMYKDGKHPDKVDKDNLPSVLSAHFAMARLYGHAVGSGTGNTTMRVEMLKKALEKHQWLVKFAEENIPDALNAMEEEAVLEGIDAKEIKERGLFQAELKVCRQMIDLLPQRITQINNGLA
jgi:tetratricopeptide (TPR) repeat protein